MKMLDYFTSNNSWLLIASASILVIVVAFRIFRRGNGNSSSIDSLALPLDDQELIHPIVEIPFDEAFKNPKSLMIVNEHNKQKISHIPGLPLNSVGELRRSQSKKTIEIVFSPEGTKKLKSGEISLPIDKNPNLIRVDARDKKMRIREIGKAEIRPDKVAQIAGAVIAVSHFLSALDTQAQLEDISKILGRIEKFIAADRLGELRGAYETLQRLLAKPSSPEKNCELNDHIKEFERLAGRFLETLRSKMENLQDPSEIGVFKAVFSLQSTAEKKLRDSLESIEANERSPFERISESTGNTS